MHTQVDLESAVAETEAQAEEEEEEQEEEEATTEAVVYEALATSV